MLFADGGGFTDAFFLLAATHLAIGKDSPAGLSRTVSLIWRGRAGGSCRLKELGFKVKQPKG
jgi:hypothetical protein